MISIMQRYVFAGCVERVPSGGYSLFFPDLSGCITAAHDMIELAAMAREALELHLEGMIEEHLPIPSPTPPEQLSVDPDIDVVATLLVEAIPVGSEEVIIQLPSELLRRADADAAASGRTRAGVIAERVEQVFAAE